MPMCESTMHGTTNFMSIGYGFQLPLCPPRWARFRLLAMSCQPSPGLRRRAVTNSTKLGTPHPLANVPVCVNGACAKSSKFSMSSPCSTGTSSMMSSAWVVYPSGGLNVPGSCTSGLQLPGHTITRPSLTPIGMCKEGLATDRHTHPPSAMAAISSHPGKAMDALAAATPAASVRTSVHSSPKRGKSGDASPFVSLDQKCTGYQKFLMPLSSPGLSSDRSSANLRPMPRLRASAASSSAETFVSGAITALSLVASRAF
mmetsp:Transcript_2647/g.9874  ORF Transcript_2647/g.9874 Transcript_2647/m.9874 type:complete len:258 (-) Transcript_2647:330-1103(-)